MYKLSFSLKLPISQKEAWDFFSSPSNLAMITPKKLGFLITQHHGSKKMYTGQIIAYTVRPLFGIPLEWVTEITAVQEPDYFIDEQRLGPYAFWHHEHWLTAIPQGVLVEDLVYYKMAWGWVGRALHSLKIRKELMRIFEYRRFQLEQRFGKYISTDA